MEIPPSPAVTELYLVLVRVTVLYRVGAHPYLENQQRRMVLLQRQLQVCLLSYTLYSIHYILYTHLTCYLTCYPGIILYSPGLRMCFYLQVQYPRPMVIVITLSGVSSQDMKIRFVTSDSETQTEKDPSSDRSQTNLLETTGPPPEQLQTEPNQTIFHLDK